MATQAFIRLTGHATRRADEHVFSQDVEPQASRIMRDYENRMRQISAAVQDAEIGDTLESEDIEALFAPKSNEHAANIETLRHQLKSAARDEGYWHYYDPQGGYEYIRTPRGSIALYPPTDTSYRLACTVTTW